MKSRYRYYEVKICNFGATDNSLLFVLYSKIAQTYSAFVYIIKCALNLKVFKTMANIGDTQKQDVLVFQYNSDLNSSTFSLTTMPNLNLYCMF